MSWRTSRLVLMARHMSRRFGLNDWIASQWPAVSYEREYHEQLSQSIRTGDCVWDVGANIGYYTQIFSGRVGPDGAVFAFEPSPINYQRLVANCSSLPNVTFVQCGLGMTDGMLWLRQGEDDLGATSRVSDTSHNGPSVSIRSADSVLADGSAILPQVVKIDVEGFEWEVLKGASCLLDQPELRVMGIEVHFALLHRRGMGQMPRQIEGLLRTSGFSVNWPDKSHILAIRG